MERSSVRRAFVPGEVRRVERGGLLSDPQGAVAAMVAAAVRQVAGWGRPAGQRSRVRSALSACCQCRRGPPGQAADGMLPHRGNGNGGHRPLDWTGRSANSGADSGPIKLAGSRLAQLCGDAA